MRIRLAIPEDEAFIGEVSGDVFAVYGDYRPLLPKWFKLPGVYTYVGELGDQRVGFVMLAFFREESHLVGDVLAIAIAPGHQNRGLGRVLLQHAVQECETVAERSAIRAIRLSVASTNDRARHLFSSCGFQEVVGDFGHYEGGQRALHMERPIEAAPGARARRAAPRD